MAMLQLLFRVKSVLIVAEVITEEPYMNATIRDLPEAKPAKLIMKSFLQSLILLKN